MITAPPPRAAPPQEAARLQGSPSIWANELHLPEGLSLQSAADFPFLLWVQLLLSLALLPHFTYQQIQLYYSKLNLKTISLRVTYMHLPCAPALLRPPTSTLALHVLGRAPSLPSQPPQGPWSWPLHSHGPHPLTPKNKKKNITRTGSFNTGQVFG